MRLVFLGTPPAAVATLEALVRAGHDVALVVTRPDRRRGRGGALVPSAVKRAALELGIPVSHSMRDVVEVHASWGVVVAYGALVPADVLDALGMLNVHFSLLPRWRGAAPVERAILSGDARTGVSVIVLEATLDTGPVCATRSTDVGEKDAATLTAELADLGAALMVEVLERADPRDGAVPQAGEATYAAKVAPGERALDPSMSAVHAARVVRLGGAHLTAGGRRIHVERAHPRARSVAPGRLELIDDVVVAGFAEGSLELATVRPAGRATQDARAWWRGLHEPASLEWANVDHGSV